MKSICLGRFWSSYQQSKANCTDFYKESKRALNFSRRLAMGGGRNCTLVAVAGQPISQWTCKCGRGYWDSGKQEEVLGGPIGRGEAATRVEYEAHKRRCATCRDQAEEDDGNSLGRGPQSPLEPVCSVDRRVTDRHARRERWDASLESQFYGGLDAEQPAQAETRRHVPRDGMSPSPQSQRSYSDSRPRGMDSSRHGDAPFFTLFPQEDVAHRPINTLYQSPAQLSQDGQLPLRWGETLRRDSQDDPRRGIATAARQYVNVDPRDRATIQEVSGHRDSDMKTQTLPPQSRRLSSLAQRFVGLGLGRYSEYAHFIADYPEIVERREIDSLIAEASFAEKTGQSTLAQTCIHQALLLRKYNTLGSRGAADFIRKLEARDGEAKDAFVRDVKKVYSSIQEQARKSLQPDQTVASDSYGRKAPTILQVTDSTNPQAPSAYGQSPPGTTHAQAQVTRDRDRRLSYIDDRGREVRPASSRHDPTCHRAVVNSAQTTPQQYRGATSESFERKQPTITHTAERVGHMAPATSRDAPDIQRESRHPRQDVSGAMARIQISTGASGENLPTRADAEKEVLNRLRRAGNTAISKRELERLIDEQLRRFVDQKR